MGLTNGESSTASNKLSPAGEMIALFKSNIAEAEKYFPVFIHDNIKNSEKITYALGGLIDFQRSIEKYDDYILCSDPPAAIAPILQDDTMSVIETLVNAKILVRIEPTLLSFYSETTYQYQGKIVLSLGDKTKPLSGDNIVLRDNALLSSVYARYQDQQQLIPRVNALIIKSLGEYLANRKIAVKNKSISPFKPSRLVDTDYPINYRATMETEKRDDASYFPLYAKLPYLILKNDFAASAALVRVTPVYFIYDLLMNSKAGQRSLLIDLLSMAAKLPDQVRAQYQDLVQAIINNMSYYASYFYINNKAQFTAGLRSHNNNKNYEAIVDFGKYFPELSKRFFIIDPLAYAVPQRNYFSTICSPLESAYTEHKRQASRITSYHPLIQDYSLKAFLNLDTDFTRPLYIQYTSKRDLYRNPIERRQSLLHFLVTADVNNPTVESVNAWLNYYQHDFNRDWSDESFKETFEAIRWLFRAGRFSEIQSIFANTRSPNFRKTLFRELRADFKAYLANPTINSLNKELASIITAADEEEALDCIRAVPPEKRFAVEFIPQDCHDLITSLKILSILKKADFLILSNKEFPPNSLSTIRRMLCNLEINEIMQILNDFPSLENELSAPFQNSLKNFLNAPLTYFNSSHYDRNLVWVGLPYISDDEIKHLLTTSRRQNQKVFENLMRHFKNAKFIANVNSYVQPVFSRLIQALPKGSPFDFTKSPSIQYMAEVLSEDLVITLFEKCTESTKSLTESLFDPSEDQAEIEQRIDSLMKYPRVFETLLRSHRDNSAYNHQEYISSGAFKNALQFLPESEAFFKEKGFIASPTQPSAPSIEEEEPPAYIPPVINEIEALKAENEALKAELNELRQRHETLLGKQSITRRNQTVETATEPDQDQWKGYLAEQVQNTVSAGLFYLKNAKNGNVFQKNTDPLCSNNNQSGPPM